MSSLLTPDQVPRNETRIPYTKPNNKTLEVSFLPRSARPTLELTDSSGTHQLQERMPRYYFSHQPDRETFRRKVRNRQFLEMVQAPVVHPCEEKYIAKDVHLKIWRANASDDSPILSFATTRRATAASTWCTRSAGSDGRPRPRGRFGSYCGCTCKRAISNTAPTWRNSRRGGCHLAT